MDMGANNERRNSACNRTKQMSLPRNAGLARKHAPDNRPVYQSNQNCCTKRYR